MKFCYVASVHQFTKFFGCTLVLGPYNSQDTGGYTVVGIFWDDFMPQFSNPTTRDDYPS